MSGYYGPPVVLPKCKHGTVLFIARCRTCDDDAEAERIAEKRRVHDPAQYILDTIEARRPWFRRCAFCTHWSETEHDPGCPWVALMTRCPTCGRAEPSSTATEKK